MFYKQFSEDGSGEKNNSLWERHPSNPILRPTPGTWAGEWIANETIIQVGDEYLMYLDGKNDPVERFALAEHLASYAGTTPKVKRITNHIRKNLHKAGVSAWRSWLLESREIDCDTPAGNAHAAMTADRCFR